MTNRFIPKLVNLIVTRKCNLKCESCNEWKLKENELSAKDFAKATEILVNTIGNVKSLNITGGEPLLRKDIFDYIDYITKLRIPLTINSNGVQPEGLYKKLLETSVKNIGISLHFINKEKQKEFCGVNCWDKIVATLKLLRDLNKRNKLKKFIYVQCVITKYNYQEVLELKSFVNEKLGLPFLITPATWGKEIGIIKTTKDLGTIENYSDVIENKLKSFKGMRVIRTRFFLEKSFDFFKTGKKNWNCRAGELYHAISPSGQYCICQDYPTELNLLDRDFKNKFESKEMKILFGKMRTKCSGCTYACYLEYQSFFEHPLGAIPKLLAYLYWKLLK